MRNNEHDTPRVSVCIPTYNGARFLPQAVESVLGQTFRDLEIIITDDGSSDSTVEIARGYARGDSRVIVEADGSNVGMVENWNRCLCKARGRYVKFLFQDDTLTMPDALGIMVEALDRDDRVSLVAAARSVLDADSRILRTDSYFKSRLNAYGREVIRFCIMKHGNIIGEPSAVLFRRKHALRGFSTGYRQIVDLEMWFHLLEQGNFSYVDEPLCGFRVHGEQQTRKNIGILAHMDDYLLLFSEYLPRDYLSFNWLERRHVGYHQFYEIWKLSRRGVYDRHLALEKISRYYGNFKFHAWLPVYKLYDPIFKWRRSRLLGRLLRSSG
jgi:glycosyltransferase involved in cell wall biosynthesis